MASGSAIPLPAASVRYPALNTCAANSLGSRPAIAHRRLTMRLIDCGVSALFLHRLPAVDRAKHWSLADAGPFQPFAQGVDGRSDEEHPALIVRIPSLGAAELDWQARQGWRLRISWIKWHRRLVRELLDAEPGDFTAPASA